MVRTVLTTRAGTPGSARLLLLQDSGGAPHVRAPRRYACRHGRQGCCGGPRRRRCGGCRRGRCRRRSCRNRRRRLRDPLLPAIETGQDDEHDRDHGQHSGGGRRHARPYERSPDRFERAGTARRPNSRRRGSGRQAANCRRFSSPSLPSMFEMWRFAASGVRPSRTAISAFVPPRRGSSSTRCSAGVRVPVCGGRPRPHRVMPQARDRAAPTPTTRCLCSGHWTRERLWARRRWPGIGFGWPQGGDRTRVMQRSPARPTEARALDRLSGPRHAPIHTRLASSYTTVTWKNVRRSGTVVATIREGMIHPESGPPSLSTVSTSRDAGCASDGTRNYA